MGQGGLLYLLQVLFCTVDEHYIISTVLRIKIDLSQYKIMLADSSCGSGLCLQYGGVCL